MLLDKKKILIISRAFYPENSPRSFRTTELVKEMSNIGHDLHLLIPFNTYDYSEFLSTYKVQIHYFGPLKWKSLTASKISWIGDLKRKFGRLLFLLFDYPNIEILWRLPAAARKFSHFDLLISIAVPHSIHWALAMVRTKNNPIAKVWVADCGDPFMGNKLEVISPPFYFASLEKFFCKKADYISIPSAGSLQGYYKEFHSKFVVIPQGFSFENISAKAYTPGKKIKFAYAGGLASSGIRSLNTIIKYLLSLELSFEFHVFSNQAKEILSEFIDETNGKIICHDYIPREKLIELLSQMDFLVNLDNGTKVNTPSKLIDYSLAGRPILNISASTPDLVLLNEFLNRDYSNQFIGPPIENYNIKNVVKQFTDLT